MTLTNATIKGDECSPVGRKLMTFEKRSLSLREDDMI